jgi:hypothetical protein
MTMPSTSAFLPSNGQSGSDPTYLLESRISVTSPSGRETLELPPAWNIKPSDGLERICEFGSSDSN